MAHSFHRDDATFAQVAAADVSGAREILTASRTYYVRTDGSDSNDGLANTAGGAFLTIQKAVDTVYSLDHNRQSITIQVGAGTYTGAVTVSGPWHGGADVTLLGDASTPSNVVISTTSANCISLTGYALLGLSGFKLQTTTSGSCLSVVRHSTLALTGLMEFGASASHHFTIQSVGRVSVGANYTISGSASAGSHIACQEHGVWLGNSLTVTLTGTPAFSTSGGYAFCDGGSLIRQRSATFTGSATGKRFVLQTNGTIDTNGGGASYFPGDSAGTGDGQTGGLYA